MGNPFIPSLRAEPPPADLVARIGVLAAFFLHNFSVMGPVFRVEVPTGKGHIVMSGPTALDFLDREGRDCWDESDFRRDQNQELGATRTLVSARGDEHRRLRQVQRGGYSRQAVATRFPELVSCVREAVAAIPSGQCVGVRELFLPIIARLIGLAFLGHAPDGYVDDLRLFLDTASRVTLASYAPQSDLESKAYLAARRRVMELGDSIVAAGSARPPGASGDLVDALLGSARKVGEPWSAADLRADVLGPFVAGLDQVTNTCAFMCYALLANEPVLRRVQGEVDGAFTDGNFQHESLDRMVLLRGAVLETLRLYPTAPALRGTVVRPFEFAGYEVEAGEPLIIATSVSHFLSDIFPNPFNFDPDRALTPRSEQQYTALGAFGVGRHRCLASMAAQDLIMLTMSVLLNAARFDLYPHDYLLTIGGTPTPIPNGLYLQRL